MDIITEGPGRADWPISPNDICCCVKRYASDQELSQVGKGQVLVSLLFDVTYVS